ncbi:metallophosphoesterase [Desulfococcaceae bacterium HSG9]|nr:metallophosphoesterase [Desulfococcaceae bacterium HSG9]
MKNTTPIDHNIFEELEARIGREHLSKRLRRQVSYSAFRFTGGIKIYWENFYFCHVILKFLLTVSGMLNRGQRNALDYKIEEQRVPVKNLPDAFENFRILHLSDIHVDAIIDKGERLRLILKDIRFDLCVITGDFRFRTFGDYESTVRGMEALVPALKCKHGIIGIIGNHDFIEIVPHLESLGIKILLNEAVPVELNGEAIWVAGVDDAYFYEVHNLTKAFRDVPENVFKVLLSHSPEIIYQAAQCGTDYYLCGHTHGGQICLPGGTPLITNSKCSRKFATGRWQCNGMSGYTSRGTGASGIPVRFFCPPELAVHVLEREA